MKNYTYTIDDKFEESLTSLRYKLNLKNNGEVLRHAVAILKLLEDQKNYNGEIIVYGKDEENRLKIKITE